jgi:SpoVK/Ycf46/Vps4 family AAA+-type ATPase
MSVKPGALASKWYGESESNVRELFQAAREASAREPDLPVVIFLDEIDAIGAARGSGTHRADRAVLLALSAELSGFDERGNVLVMAATNRREDLDAALDRPERLRDLVIDVPRPDRTAAREILEKHLEECVPMLLETSEDESSPVEAEPVGPAASVRDCLLEAVLSRIYAPNGTGTLATLAFRDGKSRPVVPKDLISGAVLANIARRAKQTAGVRATRTCIPCIHLQDLLGAVDEELVTAARVLTRQNCRLHLDGLPADADVVDVRLVSRQVRAPRHFSSISS